MGEENSVPKMGEFHRRFNDRFSGIYNRIGFPALRSNISITPKESLWFVAAFLVWSSVYVTMLIVVYKPQNIWVGPNSSILVDSNPFFVQSVEVEELDDSKPGLEIFGFYESPPPDVIVNWSEPHLLSLSPRSFKGWPYYLNNGSSLNISYSVKSEGSSALLVVEKGGLEHFSRSSSLSEEPLYQETYLSWNLIRGSGVIELNISDASTYFVTVSNLNMEEVKVELDIDVRAVLYDTKQFSYKCNFIDDDCTYNAMPFLRNYFVLTSPAPIPGASVEGWYIRFSYQPRWTGYLTAAGVLMCFVLVALQFLKSVHKYLTEDDYGSSMDLSYQALDVLEDFIGNGGSLCTICFDAPRDYCFLPCGHSVSCYPCGSKIAEPSRNCPICQSKIKGMMTETCTYVE